MLRQQLTEQEHQQQRPLSETNVKESNVASSSSSSSTADGNNVHFDDVQEEETNNQRRNLDSSPSSSSSSIVVTPNTGGESGFAIIDRNSNNIGQNNDNNDYEEEDDGISIERDDDEVGRNDEEDDSEFSYDEDDDEDDDEVNYGGQGSNRDLYLYDDDDDEEDPSNQCLCCHPNQHHKGRRQNQTKLNSDSTIVSNNDEMNSNHQDCEEEEEGEEEGEKQQQQQQNDVDENSNHNSWKIFQPVISPIIKVYQVAKDAFILITNVDDVWDSPALERRDDIGNYDEIMYRSRSENDHHAITAQTTTTTSASNSSTFLSSGNQNYDGSSVISGGINRRGRGQLSSSNNKDEPSTRWNQWHHPSEHDRLLQVEVDPNVGSRTNVVNSHSHSHSHIIESTPDMNIGQYVSFRHKVVVLFWFLVLAVAYACERGTFKIMVDRMGPFRMVVGAEFVMGVHAIILAVWILLRKLFCGRETAKGTVMLPLADVGSKFCISYLHLFLNPHYSHNYLFFSHGCIRFYSTFDCSHQWIKSCTNSNCSSCPFLHTRFHFFEEHNRQKQCS